MALEKLPVWAILVIVGVGAGAAVVLFLVAQQEKLGWSTRRILLVAAQLALGLPLVAIFQWQLFSVAKGQHETKTGIESLRLTVESRATVLVEPKEKSSERDALLRPYRRLYFYLDRDVVETDYGKFGDKARLVSYQVELAAAFRTQAGLSLQQYLESRAFEEDRQKIIGKYEIPEKPPQVKYEELERYYLMNNMVEWGLESLQLVTSEADAFSAQIEAVSRNFGFPIAKQQIDSHRARLMEKAAAKLAEKLDAVRGTVLVAGDFRVELKPQTAEFTFTHPASQKFNLPRRITFHLVIPRARLDPQSLALLQNTRDINLRGFGEFTRNTNSTSEYRYEVVPVAVYRGAPPTD